MTRASACLSAPFQSRNPAIDALLNELDAAIAVWASLPLQEPRTRKASAQVATLEERLAVLLHQSAHRVPMWAAVAALRQADAVREE